MSTVVVRDETNSGQCVHELRMEFRSTQITVRELISGRVRKEVAAFNEAAKQPIYRGLVQPTDTASELNSPSGKIRPRKRLDPEAQVSVALEGFARNQYFLLVNDRQVASLDEVIEIGINTEVTFVKLVPLVGG